MRSEYKAMPLTGKFDLRRSFGGKIILRVEEERSSWSLFRSRQIRRRWRDANHLDLASPELRTLLDLRSKPLVLRTVYLSEPRAEHGAIRAGQIGSTAQA